MEVAEGLVSWGNVTHEMFSPVCLSFGLLCLLTFFLHFGGKKAFPSFSERRNAFSPVCRSQKGFSCRFAENLFWNELAFDAWEIERLTKGNSERGEIYMFLPEGALIPVQWQGEQQHHQHIPMCRQSLSNHLVVTQASTWQLMSKSSSSPPSLSHRLLNVVALGASVYASTSGLIRKTRLRICNTKKTHTSKKWHLFDDAA